MSKSHFQQVLDQTSTKKIAEDIELMVVHKPMLVVNALTEQVKQAHSSKPVCEHFNEQDWW
ncbi:hypothetical protein tloyanaT_25860 [Thalassotalea loyana]|uniref:Uncharacterized protein n=1 Tax=Thalassotalea loyana TaxID=280483 RepID=A0ABQ6HE08_9GAMM|nr:hypothetical protein [Thalassotalea loyana]GLX86333.1 hypothetical protein tloyanaT_25860 [Thalassotalea loyana]